MTNTKATHTPGPWIVKRGAWEFTIGNESSKPSARLHDFMVAKTPENSMHSEADAHLIAAAPDLLAACENADKELALLGWDKDNSVRWDLRAAIAKAKGGE